MSDNTGSYKGCGTRKHLCAVGGKINLHTWLEHRVAASPNTREDLDFDIAIALQAVGPRETIAHEHEVTGTISQKQSL